MKKTININLSGQIFHIDEDAYEVLQQYLEQLRKYFSADPGHDEILADIEARIAEMFSQRLGTTRQVVTLQDTQEVIAVMGRPEQITNGDAEATAAAESPKVIRRLFRDPDHRVLGGVCSGISAYFGIDPVWLRLAFVVALIFFGTGVLLYLVLWIVMPEARTASDKLMMRGEPINISNIEKSFKKELVELKKAGQEQSQKLSQAVKGNSMVRQFSGFFSDLFRGVTRVISIVAGILLSLNGLVLLFVSMVIAVATLGSMRWNLQNQILFSPVPVSDRYEWIIALIVALLVAVVAVLFLILGLGLLFQTKFSITKALTITFVIWLLGLALGFYLNQNASRSMRYQAKNHETIQLQPASDTIYITAGEHFREYRVKPSWSERWMGAVLPGGMEISISVPTVKIYMDRSTNDSLYLLLTEFSNGSDPTQALDYARGISYSYSFKNSLLTLPVAFSLEKGIPYRGQRLEVLLKIPDGHHIVFHQNTKELNLEPLIWLDGDEDDLAGHTWLLSGNSLRCTDCGY